LSVLKGHLMRVRRLLIILLLPLAAVVLAWLVLADWVLPSNLFRKAVLDPIPPSVRGIRASGFFSSEADHTYVLRFSIGPADVPLILASDEFKEVDDATFGEGILSYRVNPPSLGSERASSTGNDEGASLFLFNRWPTLFRPRWFQFDKWRTFKAYAFTRRDSITVHRRLLLYNADSGEAYFIDFRTWTNGW
jgi:hypothetical protein